MKGTIAMDEVPKTLFVTAEIPQSVNAGSMQLFRVLQGYPGEKLMVLGPPPEEGAERLPCRYEALNLLTSRLAYTRFHRWATGLNALSMRFEPQIHRSLSLATEFNPEVMVTVMDKFSYYKHAWVLAGALNAPLLTITMDDPQTFEMAHPLLEGVMEQAIRAIYRDAVLSVGVSTEMCEYLKERFGKPSTVLYPGPPEGIQSRPPGESLSLKSPPHLTLGYAGSLGLGYREGIAAILNTLDNTGARLNVYTKDQHNLLNHPRIVNRGFLPRKQFWRTVQAECDAVIVPYAFSGTMTRVYRTHFPSKLSEYCWIGVPILIVGPEDATGVRWGQRHPEAALTATSPEGLAPLLEKLLSDGLLRASLASGGAALARIEFDPIRIRRQFIGLLKQATAYRPTNTHREEFKWGT
jgi:hypothetical protein